MKSSKLSIRVKGACIRSIYFDMYVYSNGPIFSKIIKCSCPSKTEKVFSYLDNNRVLHFLFEKQSVDIYADWNDSDTIPLD